MMGVAPQKASRPPGPQQSGGLGHSGVGVGEGHGPVVAEHDVEALVRRGHGLGAGVDEGEVHSGLGHEPAGMLELLLGEVQPHRPRPGLRQRDGPLGRPAPELQDVEPFDLAEYLELALGDLPHPPAQASRGRQLRPVVALVGVAVGVPALAVGRGVLGQLVGVQPEVGHDDLLCEDRPIIAGTSGSFECPAASARARRLSRCGGRRL